MFPGRERKRQALWRGGAFHTSPEKKMLKEVSFRRAAAISDLQVQRRSSGSRKLEKIMANEPQDEGVLTAAAQMIGKAAGKVATLAGAKPETESQPAPRPVKARGAAKSKIQKTAKGKLQKKAKADPPRRMKKAQKKAGMPR
jgi:hypothetical protein